MASRRKAQSNGEAVAGRSEDGEEKRLREHRKTAKTESERQQRNRNLLRWGAWGLLLALAAIALYYYLSPYQTDLPTGKAQPAPPRADPKGSSSSGVDKKGRKSSETKREEDGKSRASSDAKGKTGSKTSAPQSKGAKSEKTKEAAKSKDAGNVKGATKSKGPTKSKEAKKSKGSNTKDQYRKNYSTREGNAMKEELNLSEIRVLRRPIGPVDPDRPYVIEILSGDNLLLEQRWSVALEKFNEILKMFPQSPRALYGKGVALENLAREKKSNKLMDTAIDFYSDAGLKTFLAPDDIKVASLLRLAEVAQQRGKLSLSIKALESVQKVAAKNDVYALPTYANRLGLAHLSVGELDKAMAVFQGVVKDFPENSFAKAHIGFVLFTEKKYDEALPLLLEGIRKDGGIRTNAKFYLYAGECLTRLNRTDEAFVLYGEAVSLDLFPSLWQRSLYNEPNLRAQPWWSREDTGYGDELGRIERSLETIRGEALALLDQKRGVFPDGSSHYVLFSKGKKMAENCRQAAKTCTVLESFPEAIGCKRGSIQLIAVPPGTHVLPHTTPSNTKLQALVGVSGGGVRIRVAEETRVVEAGDIVILDDSFDTEVWHVGSEVTVILSMDTWHPDLTEEQWRRLPPI